MIAVVILLPIAVGIDVIAFVILSPHDRVTCGPSADELVMVYNTYPLAPTCKTSGENPKS
jgi:hypothetical protein